MIARLVGIVLALSIAVTAFAEPVKPKVVIIIDDIGYRASLDRRVLALPEQVAISVLPFAPNARQMAERAARQDRPVMLHMPMQAMNAASNTRALGPGALLQSADEHTVMQQLQAAFAAVPHATGVNNHMGSLVTQQEPMMRWFMASLLCRRDAYFIDSYTTADSVALRTAHDMGLPANRRHVFLDTDPGYEAVLDSLDRLVRRAHRDGVAVAIGHPLPDTMRALEQTLPKLAAAGVELVRPRDVVHVPDRDLPPDLVSASW